MDELINPMEIDIIKMKEGKMTREQLYKKYPNDTKSYIDRQELYIDLQEAFGDIIVMIKENGLTTNSTAKLREFSDLLVKNFYEGDKIIFSTWKGQRIVSIKEGKLSYIKNKDTTKLIRVIFTGKQTIRKGR